MVLSYDAYSETVDEKDQEKIAELNKKILELESSIDHRIKEMAEDHFYAIVADELVTRRPARKAAADRQAREKASKKKAKLT
jgi:c-di-AMP phosphodiesterase-like protein